MNDEKPDFGALRGQELVALHVASNQIELIFSDGSGDNDVICLVDCYAMRGIDGDTRKWTVPRGADALTAYLDRRVVQANFDGSSLELRFEDGQAVTIMDELHTPWWEVVRIGTAWRSRYSPPT